MNEYSCCYVLADNENLKYYNEMMISLSSLRYTGFTGKVYILMDRDTEKLLSERRGELEKLAADNIAVDVEGNYSQMEKSRYIKTSMRRYITGDVLYIDTDTIVAAPLPEHVSDKEFAMAYNRSGLDDKASYYWQKKYFEKCGYGLPENSKSYNSGIIWMRDTPSVHSAFEQWHTMWEETRARGIPYDQTSLSYLCQIKAITINELDNRFNVQIGQAYFSPSMLMNVYILHMYNNRLNSPIFPLHDPAIQKLDYRDKKIQEIIRDPLAAFSVCRWIRKDSAMDEYIKTEAFQIGFSLFRNHKRMFAILERFSSMHRNKKNRKQRIRPENGIRSDV